MVDEENDDDLADDADSAEEGDAETANYNINGEYGEPVGPEVGYI